MKSKVFAFLAALLILATSISVVGCGGGGAKFKVSGLTFSSVSVEVDTVVTISATVTNNGGASGIYNATLNVGDAIVGTQSVELAAKASQLVTFNYTPKADGSFAVSITPGPNVNINPDNVVKGTLGVTKALTGYWDIKYNLGNGSKVTFNYSLAGIGGKLKIAPMGGADGSKMTIRVNKTVVDGKREIILLSSGWQIPGIFVEDVSPGADMTVVMSLTQDAKGVLYVQDGIGDVDMSSKSARTTKPIQANTYGDGKKDPAGSLLVDTVLLGNAVTTIGKTIKLPFGLTFTTGKITNVVSIPSTKFNGATMVSQGAVFAKDGGVAPYVGTAGTITTTGTGDCLGLTLVGFGIDFQAEIKLVLEPVK